jgi:hypothetical protein
MESGENRLHKSSLESQCKSSVLTDHRNWIRWFLLTQPNQQLLWTDTINFGIPLQYPAVEFRRKEIDLCLIEEKPYHNQGFMHHDEFQIPASIPHKTNIAFIHNCSTFDLIYNLQCISPFDDNKKTPHVSFHNGSHSYLCLY